jgi:hypothetical protein
MDESKTTPSILNSIKHCITKIGTGREKFLETDLQTMEEKYKTEIQKNLLKETNQDSFDVNIHQLFKVYSKNQIYLL